MKEEKAQTEAKLKKLEEEYRRREEERARESERKNTVSMLPAMITQKSTGISNE